MNPNDPNNFYGQPNPQVPPAQPVQPVPPQVQPQPLGVPPVAPTPGQMAPQYQPFPSRPVVQPKGHGPFALLFNDWMKEHWKLVLVAAFGVILVGLVIYQIVYPGSRLAPGTKVDGVQLGGMRKTEAATKLNDLYGTVKLHIFFGKNTAAFLKPELKETGISVVNEQRIENMSYPMLWRFVPGSIFFINSIVKPGGLEYAYDKQQIQDYTQSKVGDSCTIPAQDATLKLVDSQLQVVPSVPGGVCDITRFQSALAEVRPTSGASNDVHIDSTEKPALISDDKARQLADILNDRLENPMPISLGSNIQQVPGRVVLSWLDFKTDMPKDSGSGSNSSTKIVFTVNKERMNDYLNASPAAKVIKKPGVTKISTHDFTEKSRVDGAGGTELDSDKIVASVTDYINNKTQQAVAVTHPVGPVMVYTRTYSPTSIGFSAMLAQFAQDNPGTYGLAFDELSGQRNLRKASYNADTKFASAGVESLYLGYAVIMNKSKGTLGMTESVSGGSVQSCLTKMIQRTDDMCRSGIYRKLGYNEMFARGGELGLRNTVFAEKNGFTSASDLQKTIKGIHKSEIARVEGGSQLMSISRDVRHDEGIPAGLLKDSASHFVGESEKAHNDTAIVYSSKGVYALTILSDGSSWDKVAALTKKIETLKQVKQPKDAK